MIKKHVLPVLIGSVLTAGSAYAGPLADLYRLALENDPQLKQAEAQFMAGQEAPIQGRAALLPSAGLTANTSDSSAGSRSSGYSVSLTQPLFAASDYYNFKRSELLAEQATLQFDLAQQQLIQRSINAYLGVLRAQSTLDNALAQERALQRRLEQVNAQFEVGLIAITDVQEAQASFDNAVVLRIDAEGALENSFEALERLAGSSVAQVAPLRADYPIQSVEPTTPALWLEKALQGNLELRLADLQSDAARRNVQSKRSAHLPSVNLGLSHQNSRIHGDSSRSGWEDDNRISLNLSLPLYAGGAISSAQRQAEHEQIASGHFVEDTKRAVTETTRSLLRTLQTSVQSVKAREQSILSRETALRATEEGFNVGTRNVVDVLQAEQALYEAKLAYANARIDHILALFNFKQTLGTLSPSDLIALDEWLDLDADSLISDL
ncbi:TolC family outer membrane protein [Nitrincola tapanii]|uniref:Transporter n=1 Tax=Nitrincola tapanii TaxID=1708751 RepID=A0A5A9W6S6_9GAMM|nr:TolC family outer membrane protein [Nitrincola tapanii]KAA0875905.1 transporter [Nitrincola tapanii]